MCNYKTARGLLEVGHVCMVPTNYASIDHASKSIKIESVYCGFPGVCILVSELMTVYIVSS